MTATINPDPAPQAQKTLAQRDALLKIVLGWCLIAMAVWLFCEAQCVQGRLLRMAAIKNNHFEFLVGKKFQLAHAAAVKNGEPVQYGKFCKSTEEFMAGDNGVVKSSLKGALCFGGAKPTEAMTENTAEDGVVVSKVDSGSEEPEVYRMFYLYSNDYVWAYHLCDDSGLKANEIWVNVDKAKDEKVDTYIGEAKQAFVKAGLTGLEFQQLTPDAVQV